jgi:hypothetical protein
MIRQLARAAMMFALLSAVPAFAFTDPLSSLQIASFDLLERGPLGDFLDSGPSLAESLPGTRARGRAPLLSRRANAVSIMY